MSSIDLRDVLVAFVSILIAITVHEFGHAWVADKLGDPTPRRHGRVSLSPIVLIRAEPFGTVVIPLIGAFMGFLFGYASTPVAPQLAHKAGSIRRAEFLIAFAGPLFNLLLFLVCSFLFANYGYRQGDPVSELLVSLIMVNVILFVFNLLPLPPLDGFTVLSSMFPNWSGTDFLRRNGGILFLIVILSGSRIFGPILGRVYDWLHWLQLGGMK